MCLAAPAQRGLAALLRQLDRSLTGPEPLPWTGRKLHVQAGWVPR